MKLIQKDGKTYLETNYPTGNKAWCAIITGDDPKWKLARRFLNGTRKGISIDLVNDGDIIEEVVFSHSGKNKSECYYTVNGLSLDSIKKSEVLLKFA